MARLFVAVRPPAQVRSLLGALDRAADPAVRWVPSHQWHVTLRFWSDAPAEPVVAALDAAVAARPSVLPPATAHLGPRIERLGPSAIVIPVSGLDDLADAVRSATDLDLSGSRPDPSGPDPDPSGPGPDPSGRDPDPSGPDDDQFVATGRGDRPGFRGHLTLGRFRGRPRRGASTPVLGEPIGASFDVHEIELVDSELGPTGAIHRVLAAWPLRAPSV